MSDTAGPQRATAAESAGGRRGLIVVDVQPTFCEGGELAVPGGNGVAANVAAFLQEHADDYDLIVTTQDWHVDPGPHFAADPDFVDSWPPHGLAGTPNAELHPLVEAEVARRPGVVRVRKGEHQAAYSGFDGTDPAGHTLAAVLTRAEVSSVDICGIAESHCVKTTALDAVALGYRTTVLSDLTVPVTAELGAAARIDLSAAGVSIRPSS